MSILKVANVHFDAAGTNRIDYPSTGNVHINAAGNVLIPTGNVAIGMTVLNQNVATLSVYHPYYNSIMISGETEVDGQNKGGLITGARKINSQAPFAILGGYDVGESREIYLGGTNWQMPDATHIQFYTSPSYTEQLNTGVCRMRIFPSGNVTIGRGNTDSTVGLEVKLDVNGAVNASSILVNGTNISPIGQQTIWVPAGAMTPTTTNGAASGSTELATNDVMVKYLAFDATTFESAQFMIQMPKSWNEGSIIAQFVWTHPSTTTNFGVFFGLNARAFSNDDAMDAAWSASGTVSDTGGTTSDCYISAETSAFTPDGTPAAEDLVAFRVYRDPTDGSDTMAVDAYLIGVKIHYTTDAAKDD